MKNIEFKPFLFKSAVMAMACDGDIAEEEITEIKKIPKDKDFGENIVNLFRESYL